MLIPKNKYIRDEKHRKFIASLCCLITGNNNTQSSHVRKGNLAGTAFKSCDSCCLPLSVEQHELQHKIGEDKFWEQYGGIKRASRLARELYAVSGDRQAAMRLIMQWRNERFEL